MPEIGTLPARARTILFTVVEEYIETAQPVASRSVARRSGLELSPATVRSLMGDLTAFGLLAQPHVSAGRVPTDRAFRLYVDHVIEACGSDVEALPGGEVELGGPGGVAEVLRRATDFLTRTTGQLAFYIGLPEGQIVLEAIHFIRVSTEKVLAVLVSRVGVAGNRVIDETGFDQRTLEQISTRLSEFVCGLTLKEARARLASAIEQERAWRDELGRKAFALGWVGLARPAEAELYVGDRHCLLRHPEFSDVERLREVLAALEEKERMMRLLDQVLRAETSVVIGAELEDPGIRECALVTAPFGDPPRLGGLGVIGPVRMRYDRVIPAVRYASGRVSDYLC